VPDPPRSLAVVEAGSRSPASGSGWSGQWDRSLHQNGHRRLTEDGGCGVVCRWRSCGEEFLSSGRETCDGDEGVEEKSDEKDEEVDPCDGGHLEYEAYDDQCGHITWCWLCFQDLAASFCLGCPVGRDSGLGQRSGRRP